VYGRSCVWHLSHDRASITGLSVSLSSPIYLKKNILKGDGMGGTIALHTIYPTYMLSTMT
jgi:hypothetical protein